MATPTPLNPATVNDDPVQAQISTGLRDIGLVVSFVTVLLGFLSKHDIAEAVAFLQSSAAIPAIGLIVSGAIFIWRQIHARRAAKNFNAAVTNPGSIQVKSQSNA